MFDASIDGSSAKAAPANPYYPGHFGSTNCQENNLDVTTFARRKSSNNCQPAELHMSDSTTNAFCQKSPKLPIQLHRTWLRCQGWSQGSWTLRVKILSFCAANATNRNRKHGQRFESQPRSTWEWLQQPAEMVLANCHDPNSLHQWFDQTQNLNHWHPRTSSPSYVTISWSRGVDPYAVPRPMDGCWTVVGFDHVTDHV